MPSIELSRHMPKTGFCLPVIAGFILGGMSPSGCYGADNDFTDTTHKDKICNCRSRLTSSSGVIGRFLGY